MAVGEIVMISIRLLLRFRMDHIAIEAGEVIGVHPELANRLVGLGVAEYAEPLTAIVEPQETRVMRPRRKIR